MQKLSLLPKKQLVTNGRDSLSQVSCLAYGFITVMVTQLGSPPPPPQVRWQQRAVVQSIVLHWQWHVVSPRISQEPQP